jgi:hypothetical protein
MAGGRQQTELGLDSPQLQPNLHTIALSISLYALVHLKLLYMVIILGKL